MLRSTSSKWKPLIKILKFEKRLCSSINLKTNLPERMQAWQIHAYGGLEQVKLSEVRTPIITKPTDVVIKVEAASVNPIDIALIRGYGSTVFNIIRKAKNASNDIEFPLIMGRDFSGIVVSKGCNVENRLQVGDKVWGVLPVEQRGCHANYVIADSKLVHVRPSNLSYIEAASILYAGLTAWSSLWITGNLWYKYHCMPSSINKTILILGGSGGVGTLAIQLSKAFNLKVVTTCSDDAIDTLKNLGADTIIDYNKPDSHMKVIEEGKYDIILDCSNQGPERIRSYGYPHDIYITLNSPLLKNIDGYGLLGGTMKNFIDLLKYNVPLKNNLGSVRWGFFTPSPTGINFLQNLVNTGQLVPIISEVYPFEQTPKAYERALKGHLRGKLVIDMKN